MDYDWEKIFENKTNKELYDIVVGKVVLSNDAILYARKELERRNFDFDNMELNNAAWKLSNLIEKEHYTRFILENSKQSLRSFKSFLIIIGLSLIAFYMVNRFTDFNIPIELVLFFSGVVAILILFNNYTYRKYQQAHIRILNELSELKTQLDKEEALTKDSVILKELTRYQKHEIERNKAWYLIVIISSSILLLVAVYRLIQIFIKH
jgi:hypothetical protein